MILAAASIASNEKGAVTPELFNSQCDSLIFYYSAKY